MSQECCLSIHTVFVARENIMYLKEWIVYHALLGVQHFYLYDNTGSRGRDGSTPTTNKYGVNFYELTRDRTDEDIDDKLRQIADDVDVNVTLIRWQPRDGRGRICYGYTESVRHCTAIYGHNIDWLACVDTDEFLFSPTEVDLPRYLQDLGRRGYARVIILQKKFRDRFLSSLKYVTDIHECIEGIDTATWAPKNIVRIRDLRFTLPLDMHRMPVKRATLLAPLDSLRFNHYNVNPPCLKWMKRFYRTETDFTLNACDKGMSRYRERIHVSCDR